MDRLAAASRWQRTQLNALGTTRSTFLFSCLIQNLSGGSKLKRCIYSRRNSHSFSKTDRVLQSLLIICISTALVVAAWAEPSPTPNHITSRIPRQSVQSSAIAKVGYSKRRHILEIEFVNGAVYRYFDIPLSVYHDLMSAESKARFYDSNIRKHYRSVLVRPRQKEDSQQKSHIRH